MTSEYITRAVVLDKEPIGEQDLKVFLYTEKLGRVVAKAVSARKITSKLNSHLEPLNLVTVRLVEKNYFQITDALKIRSLSVNNLKALNLIKEITADRQPDIELWSLFEGFLNEDQVLMTLGFDRRFAICQTCGDKGNLLFSVIDLDYFCDDCQRQRKFIKSYY